MEFVGFFIVILLLIFALGRAIAFVGGVWVRVAYGQERRAVAIQATLGVGVLIAAVCVVVGLGLSTMFRQDDLIQAAQRGNTAGVREALSHGANVNGATDQGMTPLMFAASNGYPATVEALLRSGADPGKRDAFQRKTALEMALAAGHKNVVRVYLTSGPRLDSLLRAAYSGDAHGVRKELAGRREIPVETLNSALRGAVWLRRTDLVALLLDHGAKVSAADGSGSTCLHYAVRNTDLPTASALIKRGAAVNAKDRDGSTPLFAAVERSSVPLVRLLLRSGADVNVRNRFGMSPLATALEHERAAPGPEKQAIIDLLEKRGAR